ncbi:MAG: acetolactate synthase small subunit [Zetaproteobacteria bacterium]|nr:MAG: acetolactate synthase small subunit [Zetaproteobacteria bacterium]
MRHTITILVENEFGVLTRVAGLFSARGYNIESLNVAPTMDPTVSRMTLVTRGDERVIEQIKKQLNKLIPVIKTEDISHTAHMEREMLLVKVRAEEQTRAEVLRMADVFRAKVVDVSPRSYTLELTGKANKLEAFLRMLEPLGIIEMTRTGPVGMRRGEKGFVVDG